MPASSHGHASLEFADASGIPIGALPSADSFPFVALAGGLGSIGGASDPEQAAFKNDASTIAAGRLRMAVIDARHAPARAQLRGSASADELSMKTCA
jgi:hypothetical protein